MKSIPVKSVTPTASLTLRQGLENYYQSNPQFVRNQDIWVGWLRIPWRELQKHDIMHVVTGYNTDLEQELRLIGFLLTAVTWRRPWLFLPSEHRRLSRTVVEVPAGENIWFDLPQSVTSVPILLGGSVPRYYSPKVD
jgi:ubiquinone biosynthesis protein Coq4